MDPLGPGPVPMFLADPDAAVIVVLHESGVFG